MVVIIVCNAHTNAKLVNSNHTFVRHAYFMNKYQMLLVIVNAREVNFLIGNFKNVLIVCLNAKLAMILKAVRHANLDIIWITINANALTVKLESTVNYNVVLEKLILIHNVKIPVL